MDLKFIKYYNSGTLILSLYVQPRAIKSEVIGVHGDYLKIRIKALPVEGKANKTAIEFVAQLLEIKEKDVILISGDKSRYKLLSINGDVGTIVNKLQEIVNGTK